MWRMEGCLCRLRQNVTYANPIAQQNSLGTWLECDQWNICAGSVRIWVMQLSFAQQTWPWDCLDLPQRFKSELGPSIMHDFTILSYPPILGGWANDKKSKIYIWIQTTQCLIPPAFAHFLGGHRLILASIMSEKWGDKSIACQNHILPLSLMVQFVHSSMASGSFTCTSLIPTEQLVKFYTNQTHHSWEHGLNLFLQHGSRAACQVRQIYTLHPKNYKCIF